MTVSIEEEVEVNFPFDYRTLAEAVIRKAAEAEAFPFEAEVNLLLVSAEEIRRVNREFRQIDAPTDVLSFPMIQYERPGDFPNWSRMRIISIRIRERRCWVILCCVWTGSRNRLRNSATVKGGNMHS